MAKVTRARLVKYGEMGCLDDLLGEGLAQWMVAGRRPRLPEEARGLMLALLVVTEPAALGHVLAPGLMLPLMWRPGGSHDVRLPAGLRVLADEVLGAVSGALKQELGWGLWLWAGLDADLSGLDAEMTWRSAWTTLAAGLMVAASGGRPDLRVFSTADYDVASGEARYVRGIEEKLEAIARVERREGEEFLVFVAAANAEDARGLVTKRGWGWLKVEEYPVRAMQGDGWGLRDVLKPQLDRLMVPPADADEFLVWVNSATLSQGRRGALYQQPHIVSRLATLLWEHDAKRLKEVGVLLVSAGLNHFNQAALLSLTLKPERVIIAWQGDSERIAIEFEEWLCGIDVAWRGRIDRREVPEIRGAKDIPRWRELVGELRAQVEGAAGQVVVDVTGGTRAMTWALEQAGGEQARLVYIAHRVAGDARYGDESLIIYDEIEGPTAEVM
jgi:hypothetical protein